MHVDGSPRSGILLSKQITFPQPAFDAPPRLLVSAANGDLVKPGTSEGVDVLYFTYDEGAQRRKYRVPRLFSVQARSVTTTGFFADFSAQPEAAAGLEADPTLSPSRDHDEPDMWPRNLQLCYMAWPPGTWVPGDGSVTGAVRAWEMDQAITPHCPGG